MVEEEKPQQLDPLEDVKEQDISKAKEELSKLDVLVCGECHEIFHFVEEFSEHRKSEKCSKDSTLIENIQNDKHIQIWGFMLWKNSKFKTLDPDEKSPPSSWNVYQLWCNLETPQKETWIAAGKSLQNLHGIWSNKNIGKQKKIKNLMKDDEDDSERTENEHDPLGDTESDMELDESVGKGKIKETKVENGELQKVSKPIILNKDAGSGTQRALRTETNKKVERNVEKIVSKRYNPGKKTHEYFIKWESLLEDQNTWEPVAHLTKCKVLVDEFDRNLAELKAAKLPKGSMVQRRPYRKQLPERTPELILESTGPGRPQRTCKQKALNQVKAWCGNISDVDEGGIKRAFSDSDSDSFEKKIKLEDESTDSEDDHRPITVRKVLKSSINGIGTKKPLPSNILVPDAQGVVRIDQKQLPALSSGVYVMSKTAGIIKLDSNTSKIATSGGHAVIKVAPKIGQTSIKVVKRDPSNGSRPTFLNTKFKPGVKPLGAKVIAHRKPATITTVVKKPDNVAKFETKASEDESDGLEELPFPTDLPLPEPESPPGEFTLCPLTGKIVGKEYTADETQKKSEEQENPTESLDNLVNLAAADILNDPTEKIEQDEKMVEEKTRSIEETLSAMHGDDDITASATTSSILSTAISNADIENTPNPASQSTPITHKKEQHEVKQQKTAMNRSIINRTIVPKPAPQAIITRITPGTVNRKIVQKQKVVSSSPRQTFAKTSVRQTYSNKSIIRKVGNTSIYNKSSSPTAEQLEQQQRRQIADIQITNAMVQVSSGSVINMPLLADIEPSTSTIQDQIEQQPSTSQHQIITTVPAQQEATTAEVATLESETPLLITGEDGTIYQVAGQNEEGQTILIAQDADGQQQCLLVTSESASDLLEAEPAPSTSAIQEVMEPEPIAVAAEPESDGAEESQIVAQIVSAQPPSPGGTRKVVLMLPDGNLMMTEVTAEQYIALELDK
ncbi:uncharacterized protein [Onthophagus taurus]|uniref:uncharacterized protein n=1 Tax=Onthophagus taurus TaxID=166361 RepID=UPI000C2027B8|nr:uncharacterized protein LOC111427513 [Onthophagus taurus]